MLLYQLVEFVYSVKYARDTELDALNPLNPNVLCKKDAISFEKDIKVIMIVATFFKPAVLQHAKSFFIHRMMKS